MSGKGFARAAIVTLAMLLAEREKTLAAIWQDRDLSPEEKNRRSREIHQEYEQRIKAIIDGR